MPATPAQAARCAAGEGVPCSDDAWCTASAPAAAIASTGMAHACSENRACGGNALVRHALIAL